MRLDLRSRLRASRQICPLFDTLRWVRDLEKALEAMWEAHCNGQGPRDIDVPAE